MIHDCDVILVRSRGSSGDRIVMVVISRSCKTHATSFPEIYDVLENKFSM